MLTDSTVMNCCAVIDACDFQGMCLHLVQDLLQFFFTYLKYVFKDFTLVDALRSGRTLSDSIVTN